MKLWYVRCIYPDGTVAVTNPAWVIDHNFACKKDAKVYLRYRNAGADHFTALCAVVKEQVRRKSEKAQAKPKPFPAMLYESTPPAGYANR
ncbi:hypothetical protein PXH69_24790 [Rhodococcus qingshengii]|uniref:Uncharacterized protein n=1 Tax=Rhodococcus qingshengii TaxID=334542 RepID=A0AAW6LNP4_RHOSG|nr:hypothetical protein [Rhodococcus qingshengii]MDE8648189.1 hypothetical protein [Rhodococcus qingshengii]